MKLLMSDDIKDILNLAFDGVELAEYMIQKRYFAAIRQLFSVMGDLPSVVSGWENIKGQLIDLQKWENQQDLIVFIKTRFKEIDSLGPNEKAQKILANALDIMQHMGIVVQDGLEIKKILS